MIAIPWVLVLLMAPLSSLALLAISRDPAIQTFLEERIRRFFSLMQDSTREVGRSVYGAGVAVWRYKWFGEKTFKIGLGFFAKGRKWERGIFKK